jgi:hypothetical protein
MGTERRRQLLIGALLVVLLIASARMWWPETSPARGGSSNRQGAAGGAHGQPAESGQSAPGVRLDALDGDRPKPGSAERDLFRFKPKEPPPPPAAPPPPVQPIVPVAATPTGPPPPPPVPPITLKFIGVMEVPMQGSRIAVLTDGRGAPFYGKEGEIVEGRYRILKIGVESIDIAYSDGRGRQTIRLTGQ